jgi:hypothetical protein
MPLNQVGQTGAKDDVPPAFNHPQVLYTMRHLEDHLGTIELLERSSMDVTICRSVHSWQCITPICRKGLLRKQGVTKSVVLEVKELPYFLQESSAQNSYWLVCGTVSSICIHHAGRTCLLPLFTTSCCERDFQTPFFLNSSHPPFLCFAAGSRRSVVAMTTMLSLALLNIVVLLCNTSVGLAARHVADPHLPSKYNHLEARQLASTYPIIGIQQSGVQPRLEIRQLQEDFPDTFNIYLLGLQKFQQVDQSDPLSWYGIAGQSPHKKS